MFKKNLKLLTAFMVMCLLLSIAAVNVQASSKKFTLDDGVIQVDDSLGKSSFYTIKLYKGNSNSSFTTFEIEVKGDTDPKFTVKKDGTKIQLQPFWDKEDSTLELDVRILLAAGSSYKYTIDSTKTNFDKGDISNLKAVRISDILDDRYTTGGEGILDITGMGMDDMRDLLIESSSSLSHVKSLEKSYVEKNRIKVRNPYIDADKITSSSMEIVGTALNVEASDREDALRLEFLDGSTKRNRDLEDDLDDDVKRSVSIEIEIASGNLPYDDLNFPITITMKPPTGISDTDLYILHYFDDVDDEYEIIKPRKSSNDTITFSTTSMGTFIFVNTSTSGDISTGANKIDGSWGKDPKGWYFIDDRGFSPNTTWKKISNKWFYFDVNGYMETGWLELGHTWYYLNSGGDMATGWKQTGG
ncbi:MAG: hypothetical protein GX915_04810, partial [Clostridiales bacterium]|nr:hypothetical protein [Clostridiales bacterium]